MESNAARAGSRKTHVARPQAPSAGIQSRPAALSAGAGPRPCALCTHAAAATHTCRASLSTWPWPSGQSTNGCVFLRSHAAFCCCCCCCCCCCWGSRKACGCGCCCHARCSDSVTATRAGAGVQGGGGAVKGATLAASKVGVACHDTRIPEVSMWRVVHDRCALGRGRGPGGGVRGAGRSHPNVGAQALPWGSAKPCHCPLKTRACCPGLASSAGHCLLGDLRVGSCPQPK